jgi:hypothetical protein
MPGKETFLACTTFVLGALEGIDAQVVISEIKPPFCIPRTVTYGQKRAIFLKYLELHPKDLHENAAMMIWGSMRQAFPCK